MKTRAEYYREFRAKHKCVNCGKPETYTAYCPECAEKKRSQVRALRQWYKENKICPQCGCESLFGDEKMCPECRAKQTNRKERYLKNPENKARSSAMHNKGCKKRYHKRLEMGICYRCGKRKADYGYKSCGICRDKMNKQPYRISLLKPGRSEERQRLGLCYFCDNPAKEGYKVCEKHYLMNCEKSLIAKEGRTW